MDLIVVGSGLSGAVVANRFAKNGKKVIVFEKRNDTGGNISDRPVEGIKVHHYGPHIFHTNNERVKKYMDKYWTLNEYKNKVLGFVDEKLVPIPFNFLGIDRFWVDKSESIKQLLIDKYGENKRVPIFDLLKQDNEDLKEVAKFVFDNIFANYTSKMWGMSIDQIDQSVVKRVPVVIGYEDRYFSDKYEGIPIKGYSNAIDKLLDHPNIEVRKNINAVDVLEKNGNSIVLNDVPVECPIVYTGPLDEFFKYEHGALEYRSLYIKFEKIDKQNFQSAAVINYPAHPDMTRITEYKHMTNDVSDSTIISREYPGQFSLGSKKFGERYYPIPNDESRKAYKKYLNSAKKFKNFHPLGRLATYQYINMDQAIAFALELSDQLLGEKDADK